MEKYVQYDKWSVFVMERNVGVHKFFRYLGFRIERVGSESKKGMMELFQEFYVGRKELQGVVAGNLAGSKMG